nr:F-box/FBD/LRR-repeat protein At1g13570-like [Ipomoea trifida]GMD69364.1 F-box/FBD/LRR-repeat protein At1g13570-like [Ipomoea batatas]
MASRRRRKSEADAGRDLISELPAEVKERILECLPTREAARTALLSTHWNNVWLRHGRLVFDWGFEKVIEEATVFLHNWMLVYLVNSGELQKYHGMGSSNLGKQNQLKTGNL